MYNIYIYIYIYYIMYDFVMYVYIYILYIWTVCIPNTQRISHLSGNGLHLPNAPTPLGLFLGLVRLT